MGFFLLLLYLVMSYVRPFELYLSLAPYRIMLVLGLVALAFSAFSLFGPRRPTLRAPQIYLMIGFLGAAMLSLVMQGWLGGVLFTLSDFAINCSLFALVVLNVDSLRRMRIVVILIVLLTLVLVFQGLLAYHFGFMAEIFVMNQRNAIEMGSVDPEEYATEDGAVNLNLLRIQALGLMNNPNNLAQGILMALPLVGLAWRKRSWFRNFLLVMIPMGLFTYGVYLTRSRTGVVGLVVVALLAFRNRFGNTRSLILTGVMAAVLLALNFGGGRSFSTEEGSARGRVYAWSAGLSMLKSSPVWGVGYRGFTDVYRERTAHNSFVLCFAELGLLGYFFWLALLAVTFLEILRLRKLPQDDALNRDLARYARFIGMALWAFLVCALFASRTYNIFLYLLLGMAAALADIARREGRPVNILPVLRWSTGVATLELASIAFMYVAVRFGQ